MKKILFSIVGLLLLNISALAQRPDLPGAFIVDIGLNNWAEAPTNLDLKTFQSKTVSFTYSWDLPIGNKGFAFTPGFGLGTERYSFDAAYTIGTVTDNTGARTVSTDDLTQIIPDASVIGKTKAGMNYLDVPLELRYYVNRDDFDRNFRVAIGGKIGVLYSSFTKYRYEDFSGDNRLIRDRKDMGLNRFRYGIQARVGWGGFSFFGFYELSDKWDVTPTGGENTKNLTIGISLTGF